MIEARCVTVTSVSNIKVEENGRSAVVRNPENLEFEVVEVDGCVETDGRRADWVIERDRASVVVELKGRGVEHGADQITATAHRWVTTEQRCDRIAGLIVARQYPKSSASIQRKQEHFAKTFQAPLHVVTKNTAYEFEFLFSFRGPHRG